MTVPLKLTKSLSEIELSPGSIITVSHVSWQEYERLLQELSDRRSTRISYSHNILQMMAPLPEHERPKDLISDLVKMGYHNGRAVLVSRN